MMRHLEDNLGTRDQTSGVTRWSLWKCVFLFYIYILEILSNLFFAESRSIVLFELFDCYINTFLLLREKTLKGFFKINLT